MLSNTKVYHVLFHKSVDDSQRRNFYFGSMSAIYERFTADQIGCKVETLWKHKLTNDRPYVNKVCIISVDEIVRKRKAK